MKYRDKGEFIKACNDYEKIKAIIKNGYLSPLTDSDLKKYDIKAKNDGFFYFSQIFDLSNKITDSIKREKGEKALEQALSRTERKTKGEEYETFSVINHIDPATLPIQRFLIATLSDEFEEAIKDIRVRYEIPKNAFNAKLEFEKYKKWNAKMRNMAKRELKDKTKIDYIIEHRISGYIFGEKENYSDNIFTSLGKLKEETYGLFWRYGIKEGFIPHYYVRFGLSHGEIVRFLNSINGATPFQVSGKMTWQEGENTTIKWVNPSKFGIFVDRPVTKKALIDYIKNNKKLAGQMNEYYNHIGYDDNLQRDWLIYKYYKMKYSYKDIATTLKDYNCGGATESEVKIVIHRLKNRIAVFEKVTE